jgi:NADH dehydrogenase FAD-containing subunit
MCTNMPRNLATTSILTLDSEVDVLVIGAGPTGLGAAKRLNQIVRRPFREHKMHNPGDILRWWGLWYCGT